MRRFLAGALLVVAAASMACSGSLFRQYEYEEEVYLSLDGSATVYVNSSIPALNALRGTSYSTSPTAPVDRSAVRELYTAPGTHVTRVSTSRRSNRRFVHVRLDVDDIRQLGRVSPFSWSTYSFRQDEGLFLYRQQVGPANGRPVEDVGWDGHELVAFRLHLPSKIAYHNALPGNLKRGNILIWEQSLQDRLSGAPLMMDARMETQSILYRTLLLFGATFLAVALGFGVVIWWVFRRGARASATAEAGQGQNQPMG
jgi:hypothetical protein